MGELFVIFSRNSLAQNSKLRALWLGRVSKVWVLSLGVRFGVSLLNSPPVL